MTPNDAEFLPEQALLDRYLASDCTEAEAARVEQWLTENAGGKDMLEKVALMRSVTQETPPYLDTKRLWARMADTEPELRLDQSRGEGLLRKRGVLSRRPPGEHLKKQWSYSLPGVALGIAAVLVLVFTVSQQFRARSGAQQFREFASAAGSQTTVVLRDGTRLLLGPETHVRVANDFGIATRTLELSGEAQFTVVHDEKHPFVVHTPRAIVRDVGTVFVVQTYPDDSIDRVAVTEGEVALDACATALCPATSRSLSLRAGDAATVQGTLASVSHGVNAALIAWVQGGMSFEDTPLRNVVRELARTYGVTITVADSALLSQQVTATFSKEPLDVVLRGVTLAIGAHYEYTTHGIVIRKASGRAQDATPKQHPNIPITAADASNNHLTDNRGLNATGR